MKSLPTPHQAAQHRRWERLHVAIRCGLFPMQPALIRVYLGVGCWLVRQGQLNEPAASQRMLDLLLNTARDDALPWFWRSVCLELSTLALARLTTLLNQQDPHALQSLFDTVDSAQGQLAAESPGRVMGRAQT